MLLQLKQIDKNFGSADILQDITFQIQETDKVGLIGNNGCGKSTLFKIITGQEETDGGQIIKDRNCHIGYLAQSLDYQPEDTIYKVLLHAFEPALANEKDMKNLEQQIAHEKDDKKLLDLNEKYALLTEDYEKNRGYLYKSLINGTLKGLGFSPEEKDTPVSILSGGQKMKVTLGQMLLKEPDLLLLDEPTNYLDMDNIAWLEDYLKNYPKAFMIISHDRFFLDKTVNRIFEIENKKLDTYKGNYSQYAVVKTQRRQAQRKLYENQRQEIQHQEEVIKKLKSFNREKSVRRAESREKMLEKMTRVDKPLEQHSAHIVFNTYPTVSSNTLIVRSLSIGYEGKALISNLDFSVQKGERICICGANATGKSTLLKTLDKQLKPIKGHIHLAPMTRIGYYEQEHTQLNPQNTILQELCETTGRDTGEIRNTLGALLFRNDDVNKFIGQLSGGEKSRVALAKLMLTQTNLLLLDEPTNHLDIMTREVLEDAILNYEGTLITVSHDRYFINKIAHKILLLEQETGKMVDGNYDYLEILLQQNETEKSSTPEVETKQAKTANKLSKNKLLQSQKRIAEIEHLLEEIEEEKAALEIEMAQETCYKNPQLMKEKKTAYENCLSNTETLENEWMTLNHLLDENQSL